MLYTPCMAQPTDNPNQEGDALALLERKPKTARPPFYKVLLLNDDYTPMDFVVLVLKAVFNKAHDDAIKTMLQVHLQGSGVCGVYTRDVAETKVEETLQFARVHGHPLQCTMEKE